MHLPRVVFLLLSASASLVSGLNLPLRQVNEQPAVEQGGLLALPDGCKPVPCRKPASPASAKSGLEIDDEATIQLGCSPYLLKCTGGQWQKSPADKPVTIPWGPDLTNKPPMHGHGPFSWDFDDDHDAMPKKTVLPPSVVARADITEASPADAVTVIETVTYDPEVARSIMSEWVAAQNRPPAAPPQPTTPSGPAVIVSTVTAAVPTVTLPRPVVSLTTVTPSPVTVTQPLEEPTTAVSVVTVTRVGILSVITETDMHTITKTRIPLFLRPTYVTNRGVGGDVQSLHLAVDSVYPTETVHVDMDGVDRTETYHNIPPKSRSTAAPDTTPDNVAMDKRDEVKTVTGKTQVHLDITWATGNKRRGATATATATATDFAVSSTGGGVRYEPIYATPSDVPKPRPELLGGGPADQPYQGKEAIVIPTDAPWWVNPHAGRFKPTPLPNNNNRPPTRPKQAKVVRRDGPEVGYPLADKQ